MHFSIPETLELKDSKGSFFTAFVIHINGVRHCVLRYKQLHALHDQLRREFPPSTLPPFPPKKLLALSSSQIEERRIGLERYLQIIVQDPRVLFGITFNGFLLGAQLETAKDERGMGIREDVNLDVHLMNGQKVTVTAPSYLQTQDVLERACRQHGVPDELVYYFSLFLMSRTDGGELIVHRKLLDYESPYISLKTCVQDSLKLVLRKDSWDPRIDEELFCNNVTLNMLYVQTLVEIEHGWIQASPDVKKILTRMQARGAKLEYMQTAYKLPFYGYMHFMPCTCDYPFSNTPAHIIIGNRELILKIRTAKGEIKEGKFKVTRMRCWRIMTISDPGPDDFSKVNRSPNDVYSSGAKTKLELSFEYLMNNKELQWITIVSSQAILMSLCLQSMVEELLRLKSDVSVKKAGEKSCCIDYSFPCLDGTTLKVPIKTGLHSKCSDPSVTAPQKIDAQTLASISTRQYSIKKLSARFDKVNFREASRAAEDVLFENEAFLEIRDEKDDTPISL